MIYSDLSEVKALLDIDPANDSENQKITFFIQQAGSLIEEFLGRPIVKKSRTEYYNGTGTLKLLLRTRPVFTTPTIQVFVDSGGYYGSASGAYAANTALTYGTDFCLEIDQDDGTSRCAILARMKGYWSKPTRRNPGTLSPYIGQDLGSIKVVYTGGYTVDTLPAAFRAAADLLVARLRYIFPLGMELAGEGYEERSISLIAERKDYLLAPVKSMLMPFRSWAF